MPSLTTPVLRNSASLERERRSAVDTTTVSTTSTAVTAVGAVPGGVVHYAAIRQMPGIAPDSTATAAAVAIPMNLAAIASLVSYNLRFSEPQRITAVKPTTAATFSSTTIIFGASHPTRTIMTNYTIFNHG